VRLSVALDMSCFRYAGCLLYIWDRHGRDRMVVLMPLVVSLSVTGRQVGGFLRFPPPIELNATILLKYY
jgi:hypothetical protein